MAKTMRFTEDEVVSLVALAATLEPSKYSSPALRAVIEKSKHAVKEATR